MSKRVLIVDDDRHIRWMVRSLLESAGYECLEADNGLVAMAQLESHGFAFDAVITDHQMPVMSGLELLEWLATAPETEGLPVILMSADLGEQGRRRAWKAGVYSIVTKPFDSKELVSHVTRAVQSRESC